MTITNRHVYLVELIGKYLSKRVSVDVSEAELYLVTEDGTELEVTTINEYGISTPDEDISYWYLNERLLQQTLDYLQATRKK